MLSEEINFRFNISPTEEGRIQPQTSHKVLEVVPRKWTTPKLKIWTFFQDVCGLFLPKILKRFSDQVCRIVRQLHPKMNAQTKNYLDHRFEEWFLSYIGPHMANCLQLHSDIASYTVINLVPMVHINTNYVTKFASIKTKIIAFPGISIDF